ncbi:MAG: flippase-like domain-containing protein [Actinomycetota bacterium]|nr:flippase-like domain-containing protein [Actinomycetota bacterium]
MRRGAALQAAVSAVSLAAVVWWVLRQPAPALPATAGGGALIVAAIAVYALATVGRAERWQQILARARVHVARRETYRLTAVGYMGNNVLPARGGELLRVFLLASLAAASRRTVLGTVVAERLLDALALALVFVAVVSGGGHGASVPGDARLVLALAGAALVLLVATLLGAVARERIRVFLRPLVAATRNLVSAHGIALLALSLVVWTLEAVVYVIVARAAALDLDLVGALYLTALTNLFALIPAGPGYVGTFDAAVVFGARSLGADGAEAVAYLLLLRFVLFVPITLTGLAFLAARYGGWVRYRAAAAGDAALR